MDVHRAQVSDPVLAEAHWHMMDNRTVEYMDIDEADVPVAGHVDGCEKQSCAAHWILDTVLDTMGLRIKTAGSSHVLEVNTDLPLLELGGWCRQRLRWKRTRRSERAWLVGPD